MNLAIAFTPLIDPLWIAALGVLAAVAALAALLSRGPGSILRAGALALLMLALANPSIRREEREQLPGVVADQMPVLADLLDTDADLIAALQASIPLNLNASNLTSGTVPDARLNAAAILSGEGVIVNDANTFLSGNGRAFTGYTGGMTNFPSGTVWKITARKHTARVRQWIYQDNSAVTASGYKFVRQSLDNGATWSAWEPVHETQTEMDARYAKISDIRRLLSYTKTTLPSASGLGAGHLIYVTNDVGGAIPAFSDGTSWRRVSDRAVIA